VLFRSVSFAALLAANDLTANSMIHPGQTLVVPTGPDAAPPTAPPTTMASTLSTTEVERIIREIWPDDLEQRAVDIAYRESRWRPTAQNACCVGLFQIYYDLHSWWLVDLGIMKRSDLTDARANAQAALALYQRAGWQPWSTTAGL